MIAWLKEKLGIVRLKDQQWSTDARLAQLGLELDKLKRRVNRPPQRRDQIERARSRRRHPARHQ